MKYITESKMQFGAFDEKNLFHIEESRIYKNMGSGIKTVDFILKFNEQSIILLEAKESCPNAANRFESKEKEEKFEEYYSSITEKFISSFQIYLAAILEKFSDDSEIGFELQNIKTLKLIKIRCILVIKNANEDWLAGPMAELRNRLFTYRKIWGIEVVVLNEELAREYHLVTE